MILRYINQSIEYINTLVKENESVIIALDSGTSFRNEIYPDYIPDNNKYLFERVPRAKYLMIEGLEAEDIVALYNIKYHHKTKPINYNYILTGNIKNGIPRLVNTFTYYRIKKKIDSSLYKDWHKVKTMIAKDHKISNNELEINYQLTSYNLNFYVQNIKNIDKIYLMI